MIRYVLAAAAIVSIGATSVLAQDAAANRRNIMKTLGQPFYGVLGQQAQGRQPFNQAQVDAAFAAVATEVAKIPSAFPPDSNKGPNADSNYYATAAAFEPPAKADIEAKVAAVLKAIDENKVKAKDQESLRAAYTAVNNACNACHTPYRARKS
jgi:cytochrome c556